MTALVFVIFFGVLSGSILGAYCQLYYLIKNITFSWESLLSHAIAKRQALHSLAVLGNYTTERLSQEIEFLTQYHKVSWKVFLKHGYDILFAFSEMEESQGQLVHDILGAVEQRNEEIEIIQSIEDFWASDNLFAFETAAYEQAVEKYLKQRSRPALWLVARIFRFLDLPDVRFCR
ncbi:hypothetical protein [Chlamydia vaughanii]|uniref:hypothetical protein n=1 Tax=Chlamydia vaughanii TaxID=3112552 RepID=UPI0032B20852